jgi:hypothetical protein
LFNLIRVIHFRINSSSSLFLSNSFKLNISINCRTTRIFFFLFSMFFRFVTSDRTSLSFLRLQFVGSIRLKHEHRIDTLNSSACYFYFQIRVDYRSLFFQFCSTCFDTNAFDTNLHIRHLRHLRAACSSLSGVEASSAECSARPRDRTIVGNQDISLLFWLHSHELLSLYSHTIFSNNTQYQTRFMYIHFNRNNTSLAYRTIDRDRAFRCFIKCQPSCPLSPFCFVNTSHVRRKDIDCCFASLLRSPQCLFYRFFTTQTCPNMFEIVFITFLTFSCFSNKYTAIARIFNDLP